MSSQIADGSSEEELTRFDSPTLGEIFAAADQMEDLATQIQYIDQNIQSF